MTLKELKQQIADMDECWDEWFVVSINFTPNFDYPERSRFHGIELDNPKSPPPVYRRIKLDTPPQQWTGNEVRKVQIDAPFDQKGWYTGKLETSEGKGD